MPPHPGRCLVRPAGHGAGGLSPTVPATPGGAEGTALAAGQGDALGRYRAKRDFEVTPEPSPEDAPRPPAGAPRFVVQEHHARAMHWDFRLERDGVLVSWAVPKGVPPDPAVNHLAVPTEDHPLSYVDFEGDIPQGEYGGGHVSVWDAGTYETVKWSGSEVMVVLHGRRVQGRYVLFRTGEKAWMIHRMDPPQDPDRRPLPERVSPMLATPGPLPGGGEWAYEVLWSGARVMARGEGGRVALHDAGGDEVSATWPELRALGRALGSHEVWLDGVVTVLDAEGRPDAGATRPRAAAGTGGGATRRAGTGPPATYLVFDVVHLDGRDLAGLAYGERRRRLDDLGLAAGAAWAVPAPHVGEGAAFAAVVAARGLPGVVAKRLDSPYRAGTTTDWVVVRAGDGGPAGARATA
ncbi:MAG: DNA polymerase ligase N-terminal domain-containing protein [Acidimicrobiales bacterium]